jgi:UDP-N-acetylmuramoyl-L-alanyl-D-glutamate--2,6-diaminopimelate ligase
MLAGKGDIILLAGKGHEKYQEIKGVKYPFDDKKILEEAFLELNK